MATSEKARLNRLRRTARRRGLVLTKSARRDPRALDFGVHWLWHEATDRLLSPHAGLTLDEVERFLDAYEPGARAPATCITCRRPL